MNIDKTASLKWQEFDVVFPLERFIEMFSSK